MTIDGEQSDGTMYTYDAELDDWDEMFGTAQDSDQEHYFGTGVLIPDDFYCHCTGSTGTDTIGPTGECTVLAANEPDPSPVARKSSRFQEFGINW